MTTLMFQIDILNIARTKYHIEDFSSSAKWKPLIQYPSNPGGDP